MNINKIKLMMASLKGKDVKIRVNVGRNKYEYYEGIIDEIYTNLFTLKVKDLTKSFTFSDVLTKTVQIKVCENK